MIPVFITLYRVLVYFEIRLVTTTSENVASSGKDPLGANLRFFRAFAAGDRDSYKWKMINENDMVIKQNQFQNILI